MATGKGIYGFSISLAHCKYFSVGVFDLFVCSFLNKKKCFALVMGEGGLFVLLGPQYPKNLTVRLSFRALTNEVKRTLDLPRHGAARALPLFVIVNNVSCGSVRRERGGDRCNLGQSRT